MQQIFLETKIAAPVERCFLLSLSIDLHQDLAKGTHERAVAGVTHGIIGPGETVRWRGRHFGLRLTHESVIAGYDRPRFFQDSMIHGAFRSFAHDHFFEAEGEGTSMRDELRFEAPLGILGSLMERMVLRAHMTVFLRERNEGIRLTAEGDPAIWKRYLAGQASE